MTISTLLDMTQAILSSLGSDQINHISDTPESVQVAECIRQTYFNMLGRYDLPEHNQLAQLVETSAVTPTLMTLPFNAQRVEWIKYFDTNPNDTTSLQVDQFGAFSHGLNTNISPSTTVGWGMSSQTSNTITLGTKTFQAINITTAVAPVNGNTVFCYPNMQTGSIPPGNFMSGTVTTATNTSGNNWTLVLNITSVTGSGSFPSWLITQFATGVPFGPGYLDVQKLTFDEFIAMTNTFDPSATNIGSYALNITPAAGGVAQPFTIYYRNDFRPCYACVLSNNYILFDSFDSSQDPFMRAFKTETMIWTIPSWTMSDTFVPNLDPQHFPLLLNDAKSLAFTELKQMPHQKAEDEVARQLVSLQKWKAISGKPTYFEELPSFGRRGSGFNSYTSQVYKIGPTTYITG